MSFKSFKSVISKIKRVGMFNVHTVDEKMCILCTGSPTTNNRVARMCEMR
jgi:hypothetical protein